jgi:MFS family permease
MDGRPPRSEQLTETTGSPDGGPGAGPAGPEVPLDPGRQRAVLLILAAAALMVNYVETMIIPGLQASFIPFFDNAPLSVATWILSAYLVVGTALTPLAGKLGDIYGKKRVLVAILAVYFVAVSVAGFTPNLGDAVGMTRGNEIYLLIGVRAVQGVGLAIFPLAFALIGEEFPKERIAGAQGIVAAMFGVGAAVGLLGGAWITQNYGWQLTYHTVIPVALVVLVLAWTLLRESRNRFDQPVDAPGATFLALSLVFFLVGLTEGPTWGWGSLVAYSIAGLPLGTPELFLLAALFLAAFLLWERRARRPIVDFAKLRERSILAANLSGVLAGTAMFLLFVGLVARVEASPPVGLGKDALAFGLYAFPAALSILLVAPVVGRSISRFGPRFAMVLGSVLVLMGGLLLTFFNTTVPELILGPIPTFAGVVTLFIAMTNLVVVSSRPQEVGVQTGMNATFRSLGTAVGPIVASTILASLLATYTVTVRGLPVLSFQAPSNGAFQLVFGLIAILGTLSLVCSLFIRNFRVGRRSPVPSVPVPGGAPAPGEAVR